MKYGNQSIVLFFKTLIGHLAKCEEWKLEKKDAYACDQNRTSIFEARWIIKREI